MRAAYQRSLIVRRSLQRELTDNYAWSRTPIIFLLGLFLWIPAFSSRNTKKKNFLSPQRESNAWPTRIYRLNMVTTELWETRGEQGHARVDPRFFRRMPVALESRRPSRCSNARGWYLCSGRSCVRLPLGAQRILVRGYIGSFIATHREICNTFTFSS